MIFRTMVRAALAAMLLAVLAGCATNPVSGRREFSLVSAEQEAQIGRDGYPAVVAEYGKYDNAELQTLVETVGKKLAAVSQLPDLDWHFTLLDDPTVNAFAMPGGYIYVTRGILAHLNSEAQLAGVLGHEIGHVTARHSAKQITQQQLAGLGLGVASIFSSTLRQYGGAAQQALGILFLKYSRDNETQADELGVGYATKAGYDPREIPATYHMLQRVSEGSGQRLPGFLSTHPDPGNREVRTRELANAAAAGKTGLVVRQKAFVQSLEGITFGADPRQGYVEGPHFYHPDLRFELTFPSGWKIQNSKSAVIAGEPNQRAAMQLTLADAAGQSPSAFVRNLENARKIAGSRGNGETIGGFPAWIGELGVPREDGTVATLDAAFISKTDAQMFQILGQSAQPGDADANAIFGAARSFRSLSDPNRLAAAPDRLHVVTLQKGGAFSAVIPTLGTQAIDVAETSVINNVEPDEDVMAGQTIKIVQRGRR